MTTRQPSGDMSVVPARSVPAVSDEAAMREWAELLVARAREEGVDLTGEGGLLTGLVRQVLQTGLEVEMADHLGYERHDRRAAGRATAQRRLPQDGHHRDRRCRAGDAPGPQRQLRTGHRPQGRPPARRPVGQRDLAVRQGP
jgi:hypothetical protein